MSVPILATKLYIPPSRPKSVVRPRLIERLNEGLQRPSGVTIISASAGFGKTTLVSEWINQKAESGTQWPAATRTRARRKDESSASTFHPSSFRPHPSKVAWLSLDEGDSDPLRFLVYVIAALQTMVPQLGERTLEALHASPPPPGEALLTLLLNEITTVSDNFILVLDDYHVIDSQPVDEALIFLVEHQPPHLHLVIASREDPPLPLARLRVRGQLTELRAADLRFTSAEAAEFLNRVMGLNLTAENIVALENRTEGWIAGLQLAALSMQGRADTSGFIQLFTGSHRFVLDYLIEEVLRRQPERVRSFLLQTSILDRLCGSLCDAITEHADGRVMLEALERGNLFVIPLDDQRQWWRYHHLFAEVLQAHLREAQADRVSTLHRRASAWYEQNDFTADAIRHALAAQDFERAANLIERVWLEMDLNYQSAMWLSWVKALPEDVIRRRPVLCLGYGWALLNGGELEASEARLRDAERWLEPIDDSSVQMVVVDEAQFRALPAAIAGARAYRALALGDIPGTIQQARRTLALAAEDDVLRRTQATALLGLAEYASGDLPAAEQALLDFHASMRQAGDIATALGIAFIIASIKLARGHLREAVSDYQQAIQLAESRGAPLPIGTSDLYRGLSELLCEQGDLETAAQHLLTAQQLGEQAALTGWPHRLSIAQARLKEAQGDLDGTLELLDEAERVYIREPLPNARPIAGSKARVWIRQGRLLEAERWAREQNLSVDDNLTYVREFDHLTLARLLIARYQTDRLDDARQAALKLLERLQQAAEAGRRTGSVIEILMLQALAYHAQDDLTQALTSLERALTLAEPESYVQVFMDEGEPMRLLIAAFRHLHRAADAVQVLLTEQQGQRKEQRLARYAEKLLAAFKQPSTVSQSEIRNPKSEISEPLSERELEVLKLLGTELSGPEIAHQLNVSLNTVRTHTKNIYSKLAVNNRRAAIRRAEELGLL